MIKIWSNLEFRVRCYAHTRILSSHGDIANNLTVCFMHSSSWYRPLHYVSLLALNLLKAPILFAFHLNFSFHCFIPTTSYSIFHQDKKKSYEYKIKKRLRQRSSFGFANKLLLLFFQKNSNKNDSFSSFICILAYFHLGCCV